MAEVRLGLIGAGDIAREHLKVVQSIGSLTAAGITSRTRSKADALGEQFGIPKVFDHFEEMVDKCQPDALVILVSAEQIYDVTRRVIPLKIPFFVEKPPGLTPSQARNLAELSQEYGVPNMVGFNRRYFSVFHQGICVIEEHGRLLGVAVEGHERFWKVTDRFSDEVCSTWIYSNSTHTIDLLRFFGGNLKDVSALSKDYVEPNGDQFAAIMEFDSGVLGHYMAHWYSPGGWSVRLFGEGVTVVFQPLEAGAWFDTDFVEHKLVPDAEDVDYKPGFFRQMEAFGRMVNKGELAWPGLSLESALDTMLLAERIRSR